MEFRDGYASCEVCEERTATHWLFAHRLGQVSELEAPPPHFPLRPLLSAAFEKKAIDERGGREVNNRLTSLGRQGREH